MDGEHEVRDAVEAIIKVARRTEEGAQFQSDDERLEWIAVKAESVRRHLPPGFPGERPPLPREEGPAGEGPGVG